MRSTTPKRCSNVCAARSQTCPSDPCSAPDLSLRCAGVTPADARAHYNYLLTLCIRKEEAFGPLAFTFLKEQDLDQLGLAPEEQFNLYMATAEAFAPEPKRYNQKLECLQRAATLLQRTQYADPELDRHLAREIQKTEAEWEMYNDAMRGSRQP